MSDRINTLSYLRPDDCASYHAWCRDVPPIDLKIDLDSVPTTSAGAYDILTRNISTGIIEKILSSSLSPTFIDYSATSTVVGWTTFTQKTIRYSVIGKLLIVEYFISGTSNATTTSFTLPQASATVSGMIWANNNQTQNNAVSYMGYSNVLSNSQ